MLRLKPPKILPGHSPQTASKQRRARDRRNPLTEKRISASRWGNAKYNKRLAFPLTLEVALPTGPLSLGLHSHLRSNLLLSPGNNRSRTTPIVKLLSTAQMILTRLGR